MNDEVVFSVVYVPHLTINDNEITGWLGFNDSSDTQYHRDILLLAHAADTTSMSVDLLHMTPPPLQPQSTSWLRYQREGNSRASLRSMERFHRRRQQLVRMAGYPGFPPMGQGNVIRRHADRLLLEVIQNVRPCTTCQPGTLVTRSIIPILILETLARSPGHGVQHRPIQIMGSLHSHGHGGNPPI
jgi:hypothetical protein